MPWPCTSIPYSDVLAEKNRRGERFDEGDQDEIYANVFAMHLLMPEAAVARLVADGKTIPQMAQTFGVTYEVMEARLNL